jgi:hypothetical protein
VKCLMGHKVVKVFKDKEAGHLKGSSLPVRERHLPGLHAKELCERVEEPDTGELNSKVGEEDELGAFPLLFCGGDLVWLELPLPEVGNGVDDDPRDATTKIYNLCDTEKWL